MSRDDAVQAAIIRRKLNSIESGTTVPSHTHAISEVTGLQAAIDAKQVAGSYAATVHTHAIADTTGLQTALDGKQASGSYANATHSHTISDTTGLQTALDGKQASGSYANATHSHAISDVTNLQTSLDAKQATLVSATNIKTINGSTILGSGDLVVSGSGANYDGYTQMVPAATLFVANSANATALGTQAQVANRNVIAPFVPAYNMTIDQLGVSVSTLLAGANAKCVIYSSDSNGRPTTILRETGNITAAAAATVMVSITPLVLSAGATYWIGVRASGTFTLRTLAAGSLPALTYSNAATPVASQTLILTETFANAAANWTYASSQHSTALMPLVLMRVA